MGRKDRRPVMDMIDTIAVWMIYIGGVLMFTGIMLMFVSNCM